MIHSKKPLVVRYNNNLLHEHSGDIKIYNPEKTYIVFPSGVALKKYDFLWGNKSSYLPHYLGINL